MYEKEMDQSLDYTLILSALVEIPFSVGRKLLMDFLTGNIVNASVQKNNLDEKKNFGVFKSAYSRGEIDAMIDKLIYNALISVDGLTGNSYLKVLSITEAGHQELREPKLHEKNAHITYKEEKTQELTQREKGIVQEFPEFFKGFTPEQQKGIIVENKRVLAIAGAGTGKTSVLTRRIEYISTKQEVSEGKILAITFTRKARDEMRNRLLKRGIKGVHIATFNSFCESLLRHHGKEIYGDKITRMINYPEKIRMVRNGLENQGVSVNEVLDLYFTNAQRHRKEEDELFRIFLSDCFFIRDYYKAKGKSFDEITGTLNGKFERIRGIMIHVAEHIENTMKEQGLRDFTDQLIDAIQLLAQKPELTPRYEHVLIDEYQDVNASQIQLIELLGPQNLFCVGDPRQSIYGWRGSDISFILNFKKNNPLSEIINLTSNFRSTPEIVQLFNETLRNLKMPDLAAHRTEKGSAHLLPFSNEQEEHAFIAHKIIESETPRNEIFVLARTNRQLQDISVLFRQKGITHILRNDDRNGETEEKEEAVTLATIHGIKGLEAHTVFVAGSNPSNFPCKTDERSIVNMIHVEEYDKEEEERRLYYVALSRAKNELYLTYTGKNPTKFLTRKMLEQLGQGEREEEEIIPKEKQSTKLEDLTSGKKINEEVLETLRNWRREQAQSEGYSAFVVLTNRTLVAIVERKPQTLRELGEIPGMGPGKVGKYGEAILCILKNEEEESIL